MGGNIDNGQNKFTSRRGLTVVAIGAIVTCTAAALYLRTEPAARVVARPPAEVAPEPARPLQDAPVRPVFAAAEPAPALPVPLPVPVAVAPAAETPIPQLEQRFLAVSDQDERIAVGTEIAGQNSEQAVAAIDRLFRAERRPQVRVALLANLNDMNRDLAPEVRRQTYAAALRSSARDVRTTALDCLAQLDDPQALALLRQAMTSDPDHEVREVAAALFRARQPAGR